MIRKTCLKPQNQTTTWPQLVMVVVTVQSSNGFSAVEVMFVVLLKVEVLWKFSSSSECPVWWCPSSQTSGLYTLKIQAGMFSTSLRVRSFTMGWCSPTTHKIFLESLMVIAAIYSAGASEVLCGPSAEMATQDGWDCAAASPEVVIRAESLVWRKRGITLPHRVVSFSFSHLSACS